MVKDLSKADLLDLYGNMLTKKQYDIMDMYFFGDLSFGEISENEGISRQAVADCVAKCSKKLDEYEHTLKMQKRYNATKKLLSAIEATTPNDEITELAKHVRSVWEDADGI